MNPIPDNKETVKFCIFCGKNAKHSWEILNDNGKTTTGNTSLCDLHFAEASANAKRKKGKVNAQL